MHSGTFTVYTMDSLKCPDLGGALTCISDLRGFTVYGDTGCVLIYIIHM